MLEGLLFELDLYWEALKAFLAVDTELLSEPGMIARIILQFFLLLGS